MTFSKVKIIKRKQQIVYRNINQFRQDFSNLFLYLSAITHTSNQASKCVVCINQNNPSELSLAFSRMIHYKHTLAAKLDL